MTARALEWLSAAALALLLAGVGLYECGRHVTPPPPAVVADTTHDIGHVLSHEVLAEHAATATTTTTARKVVTVRVATKPTGERVETTTTATTDTTTGAHSVERLDGAELRQVDTDHTASHVELHDPVHAAPWLRVSIGAEWWTQRLALVPTARAAVEVRVTAPVLGIAPWAYADVAPPIWGQPADVRAGMRLVREW